MGLTLKSHCHSTIYRLEFNLFTILDPEVAGLEVKRRDPFFHFLYFRALQSPKNFLALKVNASNFRIFLEYFPACGANEKVK